MKHTMVEGPSGAPFQFTSTIDINRLHKIFVVTKDKKEHLHKEIL